MAVVSGAPRTLAAAPERYKWRWPAFNSGVMVLNVDGMRKTLPSFEQKIRARMATGWKPPGHDQVSYNAAYRFRRARLRPIPSDALGPTGVPLPHRSRPSCGCGSCVA